MTSISKSFLFSMNLSNKTLIKILSNFLENIRIIILSKSFYYPLVSTTLIIYRNLSVFLFLFIFIIYQKSYLTLSDLSVYQNLSFFLSFWKTHHFIKTFLFSLTRSDSSLYQKTFLFSMTLSDLSFFQILSIFLDFFKLIII